MNGTSPLLFQIAPESATVRKYLHKHVLVGLNSGTIYRGTLSAWSHVKQSLTLTNAQVEDEQFPSLGVASRSFPFHVIAEVRVADASPEVLATLTPELQERAKAAAASMARSAAEDARIESHRDMSELVHQADAEGVSFTEMLISRGLATPVEHDDDEGDESAGADESKKKRRRGGKKKKKKTALVDVDPNVSAQIQAAVDQAAAAAAQAKPRARIILEFRSLDGTPPLAHILPAKVTRGHGRIHDFLLNGVGPIIVGPVDQGLPSLDGDIQHDGEDTTCRRIADKVLQAHEDELETMFQRMGLPTDGDAGEKITSLKADFVRLMAAAPPGAIELDPDLARIIRGLEDGSMGAVFK